MENDHDICTMGAQCASEETRTEPITAPERIDYNIISQLPANEMLLEFAKLVNTYCIDDSIWSNLNMIDSSSVMVHDVKDNYNPLMCACNRSKTDLVIKICESCPDNVNRLVGWNETTPLINSAERGLAEVVAILLAHHANARIRNAGNMNALMVAAVNSHTQVVNKIIVSCPSIDLINEADSNGFTALIFAAESGDADIVKALLAAGADRSIKNKFGKNAFFMASEKGHLEIVMLLAQTKAEADDLSTIGKSALMLAGLFGNEEVVDYLISIHATVNWEAAKSRHSALAHACSCSKPNNSSIVQKLLDNGADVFYRNAQSGETSLMLACQMGAHAVANILLQKLNHPSNGVDANCRYNNVVKEALYATNNSGDTCLMMACRSGALNVVILLLDVIISFHKPSQDILKFSQLSIKNTEGKSALMILCEFYKKNEKSLRDIYLPEAVQVLHANSHYYLLELLPEILKTVEHPNTILNNGTMRTMLDRLACHDPYTADKYLLAVLINIAISLKVAAESHPLEQKELMERYVTIDSMLVECMSCDCMDTQSLLTEFLHGGHYNYDRHTQTALVEADALSNGLLQKCIEYKLMRLLGTAQVTSFVSQVFDISLRTQHYRMIHHFADFFQLRSHCLFRRYRPREMFHLEGISKLLMSFLICMVSVDYRRDRCYNWSWFSWTSLLIAMLILSCCNEYGEIIMKYRMAKSFIYNDKIDYWKFGELFIYHPFSDIWNLLDMFTIWLLVISFWFVLLDMSGMVHASLAIAFVPACIGSLRLISLWPTIGQLISSISEITTGLLSFGVLLIVFTMGFAVPLYSLLGQEHSELFGNVSATSFSMINTFSGQFALDKLYISETAETRFGFGLIVAYGALAVTVLMNLVIATMTAQHDEMSARAFEQWSYVKARNARDFVLLHERNCLCMLPPPFNLISIATKLRDIVEDLVFAPQEDVTTENTAPLMRGETFVDDSINSKPDSAGQYCDFWVSLIGSPLAAVSEAWLAAVALWESQIPENSRIFLAVVMLLDGPGIILSFWAVILWTIFHQKNSLAMELATHKICYDASEKNKIRKPSPDLVLRFFVGGTAIWLVLFLVICGIIAHCNHLIVSVFFASIFVIGIILVYFFISWVLENKWTGSDIWSKVVRTFGQSGYQGGDVLDENDPKYIRKKRCLPKLSQPGQRTFLIRVIAAGNLPTAQGYFGRQSNPYVVFTIDDCSIRTEAKLCGQNNSVAFNCDVILNLSEEPVPELHIDIYDNESADCMLEHVHGSREMCSGTVIIKQWLANRRYEGDVNIGPVTLQLSVKSLFTESMEKIEEIKMETKMRYFSEAERAKIFSTTEKKLAALRESFAEGGTGAGAGAAGIKEEGKEEEEEEEAKEAEGAE